MHRDRTHTRCLESPEIFIENILPDSPDTTFMDKLEYSAGWPTLEPLEIELPEVQSLHDDMIPPNLRVWIVDIANRMQCPLDYPAVTAIALAGSLIGSRCGVRPKAKDNWTEVPNLWGAIVGEPSQLKTPSTSEVLKSVGLLEKEEKERFDQETTEYSINCEVDKSERDALKKKLKNRVASDIDRYRELEQAQECKPSMKRFRTQDATQEKLAELCGENPGGILVYRDELTGLLKQWEQPGHEHYRAFFLEAWTGQNQYIVDRVGRGTSFIDTLCLSVFGTIQPDRLQALVSKTLNGGNDGALQRFQLLVYPDKEPWTYTDRDPDANARENAYSALHQIARTTDFTTLGAEQGPHDKLPFFRFDSEAQNLFISWLNNLEMSVLRDPDLPPIMQEHFAKYRKLMPSLALIFHLIDLSGSHEKRGPISMESTQLAIDWCSYLQTHANRVYIGLGQNTRKAAIELSKKLSKAVLPNPFTAREVQQKGWYMLSERDTIQKAIVELTEAGWLAEVQPENSTLKKAGRPASPRYEINPGCSNYYSKPKR
jgi:hypothetical protein